MSRRKIAWLATILAIIVLGIGRWPSGAQEAAVADIEIAATPLPGFRIASNDRQFGPLEFIGGLQLSSEAKVFGGYSGVRFFPDRRHFLAVSDTGTWLAGAVDRDAAGIPRGIVEASTGPLADDGTGFLAKKRDADAEAIELDDGRALIAFERKHRIAAVPLADDRPQGEVSTIFDGLKDLRLRSNRGIEALTRFPAGSPNAGSLLAISEESLDKAGNIRAFIIDGDNVAEFAVARSDNFAVTDAEFLPGGDLLVLERRFSFRTGQAMRLRRIPAADIVAGGIATGTILFTADNSYHIDNMEGLDVSTDDTGAIFITLMSDDNFSVLQRTLLLEFRLIE